MLAQGVDVLVIHTVHGDVAGVFVEMAHAESVPVVSSDGVIKLPGHRLFCCSGQCKGRRSTGPKHWPEKLRYRTNAEQLVKAGRARLKIENKGFNTLKNHGYHLEHNFGHGKQYLSEAFFILNLIAFFMH